MVIFLPLNLNDFFTTFVDAFPTPFDIAIVSTGRQLRVKAIKCVFREKLGRNTRLRNTS